MRNALIPALALILSACATTPQQPRDAFLAELQTLCGKAFAGAMTTTDPRDNDLAGKPMVMHVRECSTGRVAIPLHVGEDRSRTWIVSKTGTGLRLKHDHRHADGSEDTITQYGGDTLAPGTATRQDFPADQFSKDLFTREGRPQSGTNVWTMEIIPGQRFIYAVRRENRHVQFEFDLTRTVEAPPAPWGH
ncbi:MAG: hypothetical protein MUF14_11320 [Hyphomonadaceae bacterium]|jgi:hypothetical protein|nr:hypothetical protein [Hyphomonadaceae bacterium]